MRSPAGDRSFRLRSVAAVAAAGLILGAAGGAVTTALVSGDGPDHDDRFRIGQHPGGPGMPAVPPGDRRDFGDMPGSGDGSDDDVPDAPVPPGSEQSDSTDSGDGTAEQSSTQS